MILCYISMRNEYTYYAAWMFNLLFQNYELINLNILSEKFKIELIINCTQLLFINIKLIVLGVICCSTLRIQIRCNYKYD